LLLEHRSLYVQFQYTGVGEQTITQSQNGPFMRCAPRKTHGGIPYARILGMMLIVAITAAATSGLAVVLTQLRKAPIAFEDAHGFHIVQRVKGAGILRYRKSQDLPVGALKGARVAP